ncbi:MAG: site-specific DNA-methyltransferase, partial [Thermoanaerobaculia bacterium]
MSEKLEKLKVLLKELFQLDQPDLDFGFYRIMHAKSDEVSKFLDQELLPQVQSAFGEYQTADKATLERELDEAIEQANGLGVDPETTQKVKDLRARLNEDAVDLSALESEVYDHLYRFFRRYYHEGDFLSKRVYKEGVYAIPYEGEEVKLYWANQDQYYIKTSEYLRDYTFRLRPNDEAQPMRVHFRLVDAVEGEHGNGKEANKRVFILAAEDFIAEEDGELVIRCEYRPATLTDWPEDQCEGKKKPPAQKDLLTIAEACVLNVGAGAVGRWVAELRRPHVKTDGETADYSRLRAHLNRYTARNTFDYFIHKDLRGFLHRELDFYIKNEVMHLDDIEHETAPRVEQVLSKIKVVRKIASKIIDFLAQLEEFQKRLWLKRKFALETQYCLTVDRVLAIEDEDARSWLIDQIIKNEAQRKEWIGLFQIDKVEKTVTSPGYTAPLRADFLKGQPHLVVDTAHFTEEFKLRLLAGFHRLDDALDGTLMSSDNFHGLMLLSAKHRSGVRCIYIDPPFNTDTDEFAYKDRYRHSSWMTMMANRLSLARELLTDDGTFYGHIDYNEKERLKLLLDEQLEYITEIIWRIGWISGYKSAANKFIRNHDTIYQYGKTASTLFNKTYIPYPTGYTRRDGSPPSGQGYPLEDTWNCTDLDQLNSIQIMSFSREKVGNQALT